MSIAFANLAQEPIPESPPDGDYSTATEYILVADKTSEVLQSCLGWDAAKAMRKLASQIRKAGGEVTIFKATKY